jgi:hypothetical protein
LPIRRVTAASLAITCVTPGTRWPYLPKTCERRQYRCGHPIFQITPQVAGLGCWHGILIPGLTCGPQCSRFGRRIFVCGVCCSSLVPRGWPFKSRNLTLRRLALVGIGLAVIGMLEFGFASLAEAVETERHLLLFHEFIDLTIWLSLTAFVAWVTGRTNKYQHS